MLISLCASSIIYLHFDVDRMVVNCVVSFAADVILGRMDGMSRRKLWQEDYRWLPRHLVWALQDDQASICCKWVTGQKNLDDVASECSGPLLSSLSSSSSSSSSRHENGFLHASMPHCSMSTSIMEIFGSLGSLSLWLIRNPYSLRVWLN